MFVVKATTIRINGRFLKVKLRLKKIKTNPVRGNKVIQTLFVLFFINKLKAHREETKNKLSYSTCSDKNRIENFSYKI